MQSRDPRSACGVIPADQPAWWQDLPWTFPDRLSGLGRASRPRLSGARRRLGHVGLISGVTLLRGSHSVLRSETGAG